MLQIIIPSVKYKINPNECFINLKQSIIKYIIIVSEMMKNTSKN